MRREVTPRFCLGGVYGGRVACYTYPMSETTLTVTQAHSLNQLHSACNDLLKATRDLKRELETIEERVVAGHHLPGFDSDVLGQNGREVQHYASVRRALINSGAFYDLDGEWITIACAAKTGFRDRLFFSEGDTLAKYRK